MALINLRNALMAGKRLPYDAEVEYLEGTGTQYILTGVTGGPARWEIGAKADRTTTQVLVSMNREANGGYYFGVLSGVWGFGGSGNNTTIAGTTYADINATIVGTGTSTATVNEQSCSRTQSNTAQTDEWMLFSSSPTSFPFYGRIYYARCYQNGVLVRDYIPVRRGTVGYLYDRVTGALFGNAGTGDFVLGQDVVPVEYIESTGTQYIVTPKILNSNTEEGAYIEVDVRPQAQAQSQYGVIYSQGSSVFRSPLSILANRGNSTITAFFTGVGETAMSTTGDRIKVRVEHESSNMWGVFANGTRVGGANMSGSYTFGDTSFGAFNAGASKVASGTRFYSVSSSAYNLRAVRVGTGSTWEGAMMDVLTRRVYRNAGTGAFAYGNDLRYPIPAA